MSLQTLLTKASYEEIKDVQRSPFWRKQFSGDGHEQWFFNAAKETPNYHEQLVVLQIPDDVVGHAGIAHGGFLAMLLDESLCFCAYPVLPHHTGVTGSLNISYKAPTPAGHWIVIRSVAQSEPNSRKAEVTAGVYSLESLNDLSALPWESDAKPSVEASQVVVEPKWWNKLTHK